MKKKKRIVQKVIPGILGLFEKTFLETHDPLFLVQNEMVRDVSKYFVLRSKGPSGGIS